MKQITLVLISVTMLIFGSCKSYEKLTYLRDIAEDGQDSLFMKNKPVYKLQPADILYIRVLTANEEVNQLFNPMFTDGRSSSSMREESMYLMGYEINDSGYVDVPVVGELYVEGMTMYEVRRFMDQEIRAYLKDPQVIVKLANVRFTVLGEVSSPGMKVVNDFEVSILEALSYAGDITYNGNRQNILIVRPTKDGNETFRIDVTDKDLVRKKDFYVLPNDVIYVEPLRATLFRERTQDYVFGITALSSVLSTVALILSLTTR